MSVLNKISHYLGEAEGYKKEIIEFFKKNPNPTDKKVHAFAESLGIDEHKFEEYIYSLLGSMVSKMEEAMDLEKTTKAWKQKKFAEFKGMKDFAPEAGAKFPSGRKAFTPGDIVRITGKVNPKYKGSEAIVSSVHMTGMEKVYPVEVQLKSGAGIVVKSSDLKLLKPRLL